MIELKSMVGSLSLSHCAHFGALHSDLPPSFSPSSSLSSRRRSGVADSHLRQTSSWNISVDHVIPIFEPSYLDGHRPSDQIERLQVEDINRNSLHAGDIHDVSSKENNSLFEQKFTPETASLSNSLLKNVDMCGTSMDLVLPSIELCIFILLEWRREKKFKNAERAHVQLCLMGLDHNIDIGNQLLLIFVECRNLSFAEQLIERLIFRNEQSWTSIILAYTRIGESPYAFHLYKQMLRDNVSPSNYTYTGLLKACAVIKDLEMGHEVHSEIVKKSLERDLFVGSTVIYMYAKCSSLSETWKAFGYLPVRNVVCWTALISAYAENGCHHEVLHLFQEMEEDHVLPNHWTLACVLRTCGILCNIEKGRKIHSQVVLKGFEEDPYIGNALVYMYANIRSTSEALKVFNNLCSRDTVAWNILINGYSDCGLDKEVLCLIEEMHLCGVAQTAATFSYAVKACGRLGLVEKGFEAHNGILQIGAERDPSIANCLIGMYAGWGFLLEALQIFSQMSVKTVVSFTALISGYTEHGYVKEALKYLEGMKQAGYSPDAIGFSCGLRACSSIEEVWAFHKQITETGLNMDLSVGTTLIDMYTSLGALEEAHEVLKQLQVRDAVSWTALIAGYAEQGCIIEAELLLYKMQDEGIIPDFFTFTCILKACANTGAICEGRLLHIDILLKGYERESAVGNSLVTMYAKCGALTDAQNVFDNLSDRNTISWTSLIVAYAEHGPREEALTHFQLMKLEGVNQDAVTYSCFLKACGNIQAITEGQDFHSQVIMYGFEKDPMVGNTLVSMYSKCGFRLEAQETFDNLPVKDTVSWNALISGYAEYAPVDALVCLQCMHDEKFCPDAVTLALALKVCGMSGSIGHGKDIYSYTVLIGLQDTTVCNCLISMYVGCGAIPDAQYVFNSMEDPDVVSWSTMIKGYGMLHEGHMAVNLFEDMLMEDVKPHAQLFSCLLTACSHSGLNLKGKEYFKTMREKFGIVPVEEHYNCMIDLIARSGNLYEAEKFIEAFCPGAEGAWSALLSACKTFEEQDLGWRCFEQLIQLNPGEGAWYMIMAGINAHSGQIKSSDRLDTLRKHSGIMKKPAIALIEVGNRVHEFIPGLNNQNDGYASDDEDDISIMVKEMNLWFKEEGHVPKLNSILRPVISDEHRASVLCEHAERCAIAFGLLNTAPGQTLRITKNLRMCDDCHDASKIISKIERREIILKDTTCIHHFKEGICSCGDLF